MKENQGLIWLFLLLPSMLAFAQELTPSVVSSSGGFYNNSSGMLSFTTGEMTAVETFTSPVWTLTQGFQQPWDFGTYVSDPDAPFSFGIYPNPSDGNFNLMIETSENLHFNVSISNLLGFELLHKGFDQGPGSNLLPFNISHVVPGMYLFSISTQKVGTGAAHQHVTKIQIIR